MEIRNADKDMIASPTGANIANLILKYNIIRDATGDEGAQIRDCADCIIEYNYVLDIAQDGLNLCCGSTDGFIQFNEVRNNGSDNGAIYVYDATNTTIQNNLVYDVLGNDGIKLGDKGGGDASGFGGAVLNNVVHSTAQDSISIYMSDTLVDGNEVYNSTSENGAIYVAYGVSNITITNNHIHDNSLSTGKWGDPGGIMVGTAVNASTVTANNNCLVNNTPNGLTNKAAAPLDAENNWWHDATGPSGAGAGSGDAVSSNVDYDPWQAAAITGVCTPASPDATITFHVHSGDAPGTGQAGYRVNIYYAGGSYIGYQNTDSNGDVSFLLNNGNYEYEVTRWGAVSEKQPFTVAGVAQTLNYRLSTLSVNVFADYPSANTGYGGYRVNLYLADDTYMLYTNTDSNGNAAFYVPVPAGDDQFKFDVSRWGAVGEKQIVDVDFGTDQNVSYRLSTVTVNVFADYPSANTGYGGYRVNLYLADDTYMLYTNTDSNGDARFFVPVPAGDDQFKFDVSRWGAVGEKQMVDVDFGTDQNVSYRLSTLTVNVFADYPSANTGYAGYRVNLYLANDTYMLYTNTDGNGDARFFVPVPAGDDQFKFDVSRWGAVGEKQVVDVDFGVDKNVSYKLSTTTIHVYQGNSAPGTPVAGVRVNVFLSDDTYMLYVNTDGNGDARFFLPVPAGTDQFKYQVVKSCHTSQLLPFTLVYTQDKLINHDLTATVSVHVTDNLGGNHAGYRVYMYNAGAGSHFAYQDSDSNGMTSFEVDALKNYEYVVSYGRSSERVAFTSCSDGTLTYKLAKVDVQTAGGGSANYRVYLYKDGSSSHFSYQDIPAGGTATWYLVDGDYEYLVSYGRSSQRVDFNVAPPSSSADDQTLTYDLAEVGIQVAGSGSANYRVYLYNAGSSSHFSYQDVPANGTATWYLVDGDYEYLVSYGNNSQRVPFTVSRDDGGAPTVVIANDLALTFDLAQVGIQVAGSGSANYRVYLYKDGSSSHFSYQDIPAGGTATWYLVDGDYEYLVSYGRSSQRVDFTVSRDDTNTPITVTANDLALTYDLAQMDVHLVGSGSANYRVYLYNAGSSSHFSYQDIPAGSTATWYLVDGDYEYLVSYGTSSQRVPFTITRDDGGAPTVVIANDLALTYNLAHLALGVVDKTGHGLPGYRVYLYKDGSSSHFTYQDSPASGELDFYLVDGDYEYRVVKGCYDSGRIDLSIGRNVAGNVVTAVGQDIEFSATVNATIKVGDNDGTGHQSYLVRVYNQGGSQIAYQWSDSNGLTQFELNALGSYEYLVEKNGAQSQKYPISGCASQALEYKLAEVSVHIGDSSGGDHQSYLTRIYNAGGGQWGYQWSNSSGMTTFYLIEGSYEYLVEKNGAQSAKIGFTVDPPNSADDQNLEYQLAKVTVHVSDSGGGDHQSYLVRIYNNDSGQWGYQWSNGSGMTTFYLIEGDYEYLVEKNGAQSAKIDFVVADTDHGDPVSGNPDDQNLAYQLAAVTVNVSNNAAGAHQSYLVRIYNAGSGQWGYQWSNSSGESTFYLVEGDYEFLVEKNGAQSQKYGFTVADTDHATPLSGNPDDQELTYNLAQVVVHVSDELDGDHASYLVRIYNNNSGQWGYQWSNGSGESTFYLIEGDYEYLIEKNGAQSQKYDFTVAPPSPGPDGTADDQTHTYELAIKAILAAAGHLVRIYNEPSGSQWGYQWSNGTQATFYLIEGDYSYAVQLSGSTVDSGVFTIDPPN
ncbi:MAG: right-handed parallel beta-helix repeat-containing protein [Ardenticatenaceae bacterium]|nr:right-handed parallel beta-helix repeat-containing protein [Ardenticatenaceae bacterium]